MEMERKGRTGVNFTRARTATGYWKAAAVAPVASNPLIIQASTPGTLLAIIV